MMPTQIFASKNGGQYNWDTIESDSHTTYIRKDLADKALQEVISVHNTISILNPDYVFVLDKLKKAIELLK